MSKIMSTQEVREAVLNGEFDVEYMKYPSKFKENHVIDEDKSVKWNREEVVRLNAEAMKKYEEYRESKCAKENEMIEAIVTAYAKSYKMSVEKVRRMYSYAYSEGHSCGMYEVFNELDTIMDLFEEVMEID